MKASLGPHAVLLPASSARGPAPLICFSHLRWDFVFQRPQHLMTRLAADRPVFFFEEPVWVGRDETPRLDCRPCPRSGVTVATPRLPEGTPDADAALRALLDGLVSGRRLAAPALWYYTPMMLSFSGHLAASLVVYDCMDELSNFRFAPPELVEREAALMRRADLVFTGGYSLYEAKRDRHGDIHPFPSSVDKAHFGRARRLPRGAAADQRNLPGPRLGYFGVIDERLDLELLAGLADARPGWSIVMVGPVVKIDPADLPRRPNIHYLGGKPYEQLPEYLAGWDVALMPFALNESTRFISPTKTPEYLAGGRPVVSTGVLDVVRGYRDLEAVRIADGVDGFVAECEAALGLAAAPALWLGAVDAVLADLSWDATARRMTGLMDRAATRRASTPARRSRPRASGRPDYLIVGAGFAGSVLAERLAAGSNKRVLLIDKRPHVGGNAYDRKDAAGLLIHQYGPHIFHTNSAEIVDYLSRFTRWRPYEHRVLASTGGKLVPIPINRTTLNAVYGVDLRDEEEAARFLAARAEPRETIRSSEDVVVSAVGRELYERFFRGYTRKQWGIDPSELDKSVTARIPTRTNTDDRYFTDRFQMMPADGFTRMFERMLDHENIELSLGTDHAEVAGEVEAGHVIYTGPIDEYFGWRFGPLPYRSLRFRHETLDREWLQPVAVVNYPEESVAHTRITEYKHLTGQRHPLTSITYEYPTDEGDPYYPVPRPENQALYKRYEALAAATPGVTFVGRLGTYRYYNMDQVVGQALATYRRIARPAQPARAAEAGAAVAQASV
jgi:UDP-galactopyranose mutase